MNNDDYKNISCHFYDELEAFASLKKEVIITYTSLSLEVKKEKHLIIDFKTKKEGEFLITKDQAEIRLDKIIGIVES